MSQWQPRYPAQPYRAPSQWVPSPPPKRKSWVRRHKILTCLIVGAAVLIVIIAAATGLGARKLAAASLAACTSHHAVTERQWLQITKDPDAAKGQCVTVYGQVTQFDSVTGDNAFRAQAGGVTVSTAFGVAAYPTNTLFEGDGAALSALVQGDLFTAQVTVAGTKSYDTTLGGSTTAPLLRVDSVTRTGHLDVP